MQLKLAKYFFSQIAIKSSYEGYYKRHVGKVVPLSGCIYHSPSIAVKGHVSWKVANSKIVFNFIGFKISSE